MSADGIPAPEGDARRAKVYVVVDWDTCLPMGGYSTLTLAMAAGHASRALQWKVAMFRLDAPCAADAGALDFRVEAISVPDGEDGEDRPLEAPTPAHGWWKLWTWV